MIDSLVSGASSVNATLKRLIARLAETVVNSAASTVEIHRPYSTTHPAEGIDEQEPGTYSGQLSVSIIVIGKQRKCKLQTCEPAVQSARSENVSCQTVSTTVGVGGMHGSHEHFQMNEQVTKATRHTLWIVSVQIG
jgi:hypothetical protein